MILSRFRNSIRLSSLNFLRNRITRKCTKCEVHTSYPNSNCRLFSNRIPVKIVGSIYNFNGQVNLVTQGNPTGDTLVKNLTRCYAKTAPIKGKAVKPKVHLTEEVLNEVIDYDSLKERFQSILEKLKEDYVNGLSVRSLGNIETLPITVEGEVFPLNEIAQIFRKNPQLIVINMTNFQEGQQAVMEALKKSGMNINPQQDGAMIYVPLSKVTREHRQKLTVSAKVMFNKAKVSLKDVQNKYIREAQSHEDLSKDLIFNTGEHIRFLYEVHVLEAETLFKMKEKELLGEDALK